MSLAELEKRLSHLEAEFENLKEALPTAGKRPWWEEVAGAFAGDPLYAEAMRLGRKYRASTRPKTRKRRNGRAGH